MNFNLEGKTVWVTGASRGLGRALAQGLSASGAKVVATSRKREALIALQEELGADRIDVVPLSVNDTEAVDAAVRESFQKYGFIDGLVNCAGVSPSFDRSERVKDVDWDEVLDINLTGAFKCCRAYAEHALPHGRGSIVNISSVHASAGHERLTGYAASKGGMESMTRSLAVEWASEGIRVNSVAPGYFWTDMSSPILDSPRGDKVRASIPMGRTGEPAELVGAVGFLLGDASSYVTGATLPVDGGWLAW